MSLFSPDPFTGGSPSRLQEQLKYGYDAAHNLNYRTNNALVETFAVNSLNELSNVTRTGTLTVAGTTTSAATGVTVNGSAANRYNDATFALGGFTVTNGDNTFTAIADDSLGRYATNSITCYLPGTNSFTYDLNGNLTSDGYRTFTYDDENELTSIVVSNGVNTPTLTSNIYDGKMRLRIRREYTWSSGWQWTMEVHYVYDGNLVIQERDINNLSTVTYTRGRDLSGSLQGAGGIGGLLARTQNPLLLDEGSASQATSYYHADGNGNVTMLINSSQGIVAKYEYDPYGNVLSLSGSLASANAYRFSSKEYFQNSGLIYYLYRFYDPNLQRWLNRDPIRELGGINLYEFVLNNPEFNFDFLGLAMVPRLIPPHGHPRPILTLPPQEPPSPQSCPGQTTPSTSTAGLNWWQVLLLSQRLGQSLSGDPDIDLPLYEDLEPIASYTETAEEAAIEEAAAAAAGTAGTAAGEATGGDVLIIILEDGWVIILF
jgi:RHS repeat-associated protein